MPVDRNALRRALYLGLGVIAQAQAEMHSLSKRESQIDEPGMVVRHPRICAVIADGKDTTIEIEDGFRHRRRQARRSEDHTSELQSLMRILYAVFCLTKHKILHTNQIKTIPPHQTP